jgi:hypothetical protein
MNKRLLMVSAVLLSLGSVSTNDALGQTILRRVFLLQDSEHQHWCAYRTESAWASEVKSLSSPVVASFEYADGRVSKVSVTEEDEAGDWIAYDAYALNENGDIEALRRTFNILADDRKVDVTYAIKDGKAMEVAKTSRRLSTKEILPSQKDWLPGVPTFTRVQDFPFFPILADKHPEAWPKGRKCSAIKPLQ